MKDHLHVLVIDDSAVVRRTVHTLLAGREGWTVTAASDGVMALDRIREKEPDVILLDLEMPRLDGLTFLKHLMATHPIPVVVCSSFAEPGSEMAQAVLRAGARQIVSKPQLAVKEFLEGPDSDLASVLRRVASRGASPAARARRMPEIEGSSPSERPAPESLAGGVVAATSGSGTGSPSHPKEVVLPILLGASMGGPSALRQLLAAFPADGPPCLIVQHMQGSFTRDFARRLDAAVAMEVREAERGDTLEQGRVLIAPGDHHLLLTASSRGEPTLDFSDAPTVSGHRPSIDVLFRSTAEALGASAVAALLTGMGRDGAEGLLALRHAGAATFAQDADGCTVFGMPGAAVALGAAERVVRLDALAGSLLEASGRARVRHAGRGSTRGVRSG
jgi:two-component system chemotaxis response regulator CheB